MCEFARSNDNSGREKQMRSSRQACAWISRSWCACSNHSLIWRRRTFWADSDRDRLISWTPKHSSPAERIRSIDVATKIKQLSFYHTLCFNLVLFYFRKKIHNLLANLILFWFGRFIRPIHLLKFLAKKSYQNRNWSFICSRTKRM